MWNVSYSLRSMSYFCLTASLPVRSWRRFKGGTDRRRTTSRIRVDPEYCQRADHVIRDYIAADWTLSAGQVLDSGKFCVQNFLSQTKSDFFTRLMVTWEIIRGDHHNWSLVNNEICDWEWTEAILVIELKYTKNELLIYFRIILKNNCCEYLDQQLYAT